MARIGYVYAGDEAGFFEKIEFLMQRAYESLEIKRRYLTKLLADGLYPYTKRYLGSYRNHFSTIGVNGMHEAIRNFTQDKESITSPRGQAFALRVLTHMREKLQSYQELSGNLYNLEATPAEGTTYRFAKADKARFSHILTAGTAQAPYYTNSSQVPVEWSDDVFAVLDAQNTLQCQYTGGTVLHVYLGERLPDAHACKSLVKKIIASYQLPYITITPTFSICPKHGYLSGEHDYCPLCDAEIGYVGQPYDRETRMVYTHNPQKMEQLCNAI